MRLVAAALATVALCLPIDGIARGGEAPAAAAIKQCKHRHAGAGKGKRQARKRCIRKARAATRPKGLSPSAGLQTSTQPRSSGDLDAGGAGSIAPVAVSPIEVAPPDAAVAVGSVVNVPPPDPLTSLVAIEGTVVGAEAGVSAQINEGVLAVSASASAAIGSKALTIKGTSCTISECDRQFVMRLHVTVRPISATTGNLESVTQPSPDRVAAAIDDQLPDEVLILLGSTESPGTRDEADADAAAVGGVVAGGLSEEGIYQVRWSAPQGLATRIGELEGRSGVSAVTPSYVGLVEEQAAYAPTVGSAYDQPQWTWRYDQVHASQAWSQSTGSDITVGIIDTGNAFAASPDLRVSRTLNSIAVPGAHATHVAGLACGKPNGGGMAGLAWGCPIVTTYAESTGGAIPDANVMAAMQRVIKAPGVRIVNISMGAGSGCATQTYRAQIQGWITHSRMFFRRFLEGPGRGIVWTFSAGNNCMYGPSSPWAANSDLPNVIDVAATNADERLASFSNYGVDVAAPGGVQPTSPAIDLQASCDSDHVLNAGRCGLLSSTVSPCAVGYCAARGEMAGTSMASPVVAGIAALVASKHPSFTAAKIAGCVESTAGTEGVGSTGPPNSQPGGAYTGPPGPFVGTPTPIVNAAAAVECPGVPTRQVTPHGPMSGPAGFGLEVIVPICTYLEVSFDGVPGFVQGAYGPSNRFVVVTPSTLPSGQHQMSFTCQTTWWGEPVWVSPGFQVAVTGSSTPLTLESGTVPAGGELIFTSGPSLSSTQCPSLPGVSLYGLSIYLDSGVDGSVVASRFVPMPDGAASEGLVVPPETAPGSYVALDRCYYSNSASEIGVFEFAWEWGNVTVTDGSGFTASPSHESLRQMAPPASIAPAPGQGERGSTWVLSTSTLAP